jgi:hypothetical protein
MKNANEFYIVVSKFGFFSSKISVHQTYSEAQGAFENEKQSKATEIHVHGPLTHGEAFDPLNAPKQLSYAYPCLGKK